MDFNLPSNWWVSHLQKSEFAVLVLGFEKLALELDNSGRTSKNAYCPIYSLRVSHRILSIHVHCIPFHPFLRVSSHFIDYYFRSFQRGSTTASATRTVAISFRTWSLCASVWRTCWPLGGTSSSPCCKCRWRASRLRGTSKEMDLNILKKAQQSPLQILNTCPTFQLQSSFGRSSSSTASVVEVNFFSGQWIQFEFVLWPQTTRVKMVVFGCTRAQTTRVKMVVFGCTRVAWQFQTSIRFSGVKEWLILEWEAGKLYRVRSMSKSHWLYVSKCPLYSSPAGGMLMLSCLAFWHAKLISRGETSIEAHINKAEAKRLATIGKVSQLNGFPKNDFKLLSLQPLFPIDYRCDDRRFWLSAPNCQVSTPTSQNLDLEQPIRIFEAD